MLKLTSTIFLTVHLRDQNPEVSGLNQTGRYGSIFYTRHELKIKSTFKNQNISHKNSDVFQLVLKIVRNLEPRDHFPAWPQAVELGSLVMAPVTA